MRFGPVPVDEALGAVLAHSLDLPGGRISKGKVLAADDVARLRAAGLVQVTVARLGPGDVPEDRAAQDLAMRLVPGPDRAGIGRSQPHAGRVNLNATRPGILEYDPGRVLALNRVDPSLTLAVLAPWSRVRPGMMIGTVKVITYGVDQVILARAGAAAPGALRVRPVVMETAGLVLTAVGAGEEKLQAKAEKVVSGRLRVLGMRLAEVRIVPHESGAVAEALRAIAGDIALILTAAATSDPRDCAPEAVRQAGGQVLRFGMPVDPGNLLFHGRLPGRPVIGLPGCARSPALNGADWVLERLVCGIEPGDDDIAAMGIGGLLKEIPIRPHPRERG